METSDREVLNKMQEKITTFRAVGDLAYLADSLLTLRDSLKSHHKEWEDELTQEIATLDSASTFVPVSDEQASRLSAAVNTAIENILSLIDHGLSMQLPSTLKTPPHS
jgi:hypothetical protein